MTTELKIILSAIGVIALALVIWAITVLRDARKLREEAWRRRCQDAQREELFSPEHWSKATEEYRMMQKLRKEAGAPILDLPDDEDTKTRPPGAGA